MPYIPPAIDAVDFELQVYTPPAIDAVDFELEEPTAVPNILMTHRHFSRWGLLRR